MDSPKVPCFMKTLGAKLLRTRKSPHDSFCRYLDPDLENKNGLTWNTVNLPTVIGDETPRCRYFFVQAETVCFRLMSESSSGC